MIIVDGSKSDKEISGFENLEELLTALMQDEKLEGRIVTDVIVNNEPFSEIYPHQAEDMSCEGISSVELRTVPVAQMTVDIAGEMDKVAKMMANGAKHVARLFREASDADALELLQDLLDVTRDFMAMTGVLRDRVGGVDEDFLARTAKLTDLVTEMSDVLENEDWILLADLLEYEFMPQCEEWQAFSRTLHQQVSAGFAQ
ncbi:MAG: hypothetical protein Q4F27_01365 [Desulfovibrionaceae bacterium]|nr:hypothetical protein [Desulfovibrionaceae bacterium]